SSAGVTWGVSMPMSSAGPSQPAKAAASRSSRPEEATAHPRRAMLLKALPAGASTSADLRLHDVRPGDRYLLCSDGLCGVVPDARIRALLTSAPAPDEAVLTLITEANTSGGPDNVSCVVADVVETAA
ncbi:PP2C family protein-serine/threonine phosphatase, partial [Streptomyces cellulosae]